MIGLVKSELLKIRTTHVWWLMLLGLVVITGIALAINCFVAAESIKHPEPPPDLTGADEQTAKQIRDQYNLTSNVAFLAANIYTSGQKFGLLIPLIMGVLIVTNEFFHQTATPTFLTTPKRTQVIAAKLGGALSWGLVLGLVSTAISVTVGLIFFATLGADNRLTDSHVVTAILLNLLAYAIWAVFGLGLGTLLKNQIAAVVVALVLFLIAEPILKTTFMALSFKFEAAWILKAMYYLPSAASEAMVSGVRIPDAPPWWGAALILLAYGVVAGGIGTLITRRRDIS